MQPSRDIVRLIEIMATLRTPDIGCSWDLAQTFQSILPYTIEEAFEVADAIDRDDRSDLRDELGDLLLQVVFHARMAEEEHSFDFGDVVGAITSKLIRRHPHVFDRPRDLTPEATKRLWNEIKAREKTERTASESSVDPRSLLDDVPRVFPPLLRATKLQDKAAGVGFDWPDASSVVAKIKEETAEVEVALTSGDRAATEDEIGDLLFAVVNLARHARVDPDQAIRGANAKFARRFGYIESTLAIRGTTPREATLEEMEKLWSEAKHAEPGR